MGIGGVRPAAASAVMTSSDGRGDGPLTCPRLLDLFGGDASAMTSIRFPLTEDSPDAWDALTAEASSRWAKAYPRRALLVGLLAFKRKRQGRSAGRPNLLEMVQRQPFEALKAHHQWLLHLARLRDEGRDDFDGNCLEDLLGD